MTVYIWESITWKYIHGSPTILIFAREQDTKKLRTITIRGFKPHMYIEDKRGTELNCFGVPISRIDCLNPIDLQKKREQYKAQNIATFDSDIAYEMQYLLDNKITYAFNEKMQPVEITTPLMPRVCYFDIEVNIPVGEQIDEEKNKYPIVAISTLDSYNGEGKVFTIGDKKVHNKQVPCHDEQGLITEFFKYIKESNPDIIAGWNSIDFDMPYILGRARIYNISTKPLSRTDMEIEKPDRLSGRVHMDMMVYFKDWSKPLGQFPSYGLKYISKHFAGFEYEAFGAKIQTLIANNDWNTLVEYNFNDVLALQKIDVKANLVGYHENLRRLCGIKFESTIKRTHIVETLLMRHGIKPMPHRKKHNAKGIEGGYVKQPTMGIKNNVATLDAKSLYPSIIIAKNISPDVDFMIPKVITFILNEREKYRKLKLEGKATEIDKITEQSLKFIANAHYGVIASPYFKLFDENCAAEITQTGREIVKGMSKFIEEKGYKVCYNDTDSTFIENINSVEEAKQLESDVNNYLKQWAKGYNIKDEFAPIVKFEKYYKRLFFKKRTSGEEAARKKYAGRLIWKDGKDVEDIDYTGIEIKRSDTAPYTKEIMEDFFKELLINGDEQKAINVVKKAYKDLSSGNIKAHQIAIPKAIHSFGVESAHIKGTRNGAELLGIRFDLSKKPKLLYCVSPYKEICIEDDTPEELIKEKITIDYFKMADRLITQKMKSLIESLGYSWDCVICGQTTFGDDLWN